MPCVPTRGAMVSKSVRVFERSGWTLLVYKISGLRDLPNPLIHGPQFNDFLRHHFFFTPMVGLIRMGVKLVDPVEFIVVGGGLGWVIGFS